MFIFAEKLHDLTFTFTPLVSRICSIQGLKYLLWQRHGFLRGTGHTSKGYVYINFSTGSCSAIISFTPFVVRGINDQLSHTRYILHIIEIFQSPSLAGFIGGFIFNLCVMCAPRVFFSCKMQH